MIQEQSYLEVADNSGARKLMCIRVLGGSKKKFAKVGDVIKVTIKEAIPTGRVKKGEVVDAGIVRTKNKLRPVYRDYDRLKNKEKEFLKSR